MVSIKYITNYVPYKCFLSGLLEVQFLVLNKGTVLENVKKSSLYGKRFSFLNAVLFLPGGARRYKFRPVFDKEAR